MKLSSLTRMWLTRSFTPFTFKAEHDESLSYQNTKDLGLYVHIPFCRKLCSFCPYCKVVYKEDLALRYKNALLEEIRMVGRMSPVPVRITSLYFGGGTPALLANHLKEIIDTFREYFLITDGIGVELHPENVTVETLRMLKEAGVTKISIGIQAFDKKGLSQLGRDNGAYEPLFDALRQIPFETVSMDLIFAIPGQTAESLQQDISTAFDNGANHIAIYPFIEFSFSRNKVRPMSESQKKKLLSHITAYCREKGYVRTSLWTFAKKETKKYSSMTRDNFLGFGCSATTLLKDQFKINTFDVEEYIGRIQAGHLPTSLTLRFTERQRMCYYLFWNIYSTLLDPYSFELFFGIPLKKRYGMELLLCRLLGILKKEGTRYRLTDKGVYYYHYFEQFYTLSYIDKMWNVMRKTPFPEKIILD